MIGHYFKRRRQFVEMIVMAGEGVGIALFSVILKEGVGWVRMELILQNWEMKREETISNEPCNPFWLLILEFIETEENFLILLVISFRSKIGWRLGLQFVTVLVSLSFFMGLLYRPASLYHPQRRAIIHLKNSRKKVCFESFVDPPQSTTKSLQHSIRTLILRYDIDWDNFRYLGNLRDWSNGKCSDKHRKLKSVSNKTVSKGSMTMGACRVFGLMKSLVKGWVWWKCLSSFSLAGEGEKVSHPNAKAAVPRFLSPSVFHCPDAMHSRCHRSVRCLHACLLFGEF